MYNRFDSGVHPREEILDTLASGKEHSSSLEDHIRLLEMVSTSFLKKKYLEANQIFLFY